MLRLLAAAVISLLILGGLSLFIAGREGPAYGDVVERTNAKAAGAFSVDVTLSFSPTASDPFAVVEKQATPRPAVVLKLNGREILSVDKEIPAGELITANDVAGVVVGRNEFLVEADPPLDVANRAHAIRVRVQRDGKTVAEKTTWSEPGTRLVSRMLLDVPAEKQAEAAADE
jgi:hypothetical protein